MGRRASSFRVSVDVEEYGRIIEIKRHISKRKENCHSSPLLQWGKVRSGHAAAKEGNSCLGDHHTVIQSTKRKLYIRVEVKTGEELFVNLMRWTVARQIKWATKKPDFILLPWENHQNHHYHHNCHHIYHHHNYHHHHHHPYALHRLCPSVPYLS